jgi:amino acid transporter
VLCYHLLSAGCRSRDGLLPEWFAHVHPLHGTPYKSTLLTGVMVALVSSLIPLSILVELVSIGTLLAFCIVCTSVLVLRYTAPDLPRKFRTPFVPFVPAAGAALCFLLVLHLPSLSSLSCLCGASQVLMCVTRADAVTALPELVAAGGVAVSGADCVRVLRAQELAAQRRGL